MQTSLNLFINLLIIIFIKTSEKLFNKIRIIPNSNYFW